MVRLDASPVRDPDELRFLLRDVPVGTKVSLGVVRGKEGTDIGIVAAPLTAERAQAIFEARTGLLVSELSAREARQAGYESKKPLLSMSNPYPCVVRPD